jgi:hypothetical protein
MNQRLARKKVQDPIWKKTKQTKTKTKLKPKGLVA